MSKRTAVLLAVVAASVLVALTGPRHDPATPPPGPGRETPALLPEHVRAVGESLVTDDLIAGRVSLAEAAARFRALEQLAESPGPGDPGAAYVRPGPWSCLAADTNADRLCLRVLVRVEAVMEFNPPGDPEEVFARLVREYLELRPGGRPSVVPDLPPDRRDAYLTLVRQAAERAASGPVPAR